jgi:hypothetical protein
MVFLLLFLVFYFVFLKKDDDGEVSAEEFEIAFINDGVLSLSDIKGENRINRVHGSFVVWAPSGDALYYIDNYSKLKHYDLESKKSEDVAVNVSSFTVSPDGNAIAFVEDTENPSLAIIEAPGGEPIFDIPSGRSPRWLLEGGFVYIKEGDIYSVKTSGSGTRKLFSADAVDLDVSPDGKFVLFTEEGDGKSRLVLGKVAGGSKKVVKEVSLTGVPTEASPLGFSLPRFLSKSNVAFFAYNDGKGGRLFKINADDGSIEGVCMERGPLFSISVSPDDDRIAYFYMSRMDLPSFKIKAGEGDEMVVMEFTPADLKSEFNKKLLDMEDEGTLTGDKVNKNSVTRVMDSDRIKIVDLERGVTWYAGSGQYPSLR